MRNLVLLVVMAVVGLPLAGQTAAKPRGIQVEGPRRRALVIGNRNYPKQPLLNPVNDATDLAQVLADAEFDVTLKTDLNRQTLDRAVSDFAKSLHEGDTALFFFAGHGVEVQGQNYLLPTDFAAQEEAQVKYQSVNAGEVQDLLQGRDAKRTVILILDACRNNPYRTWRATGGGLATMSGEGVYIAFAAAAGKMADDGRAGRNGIFTKHLLTSLRESGLSIDQVFTRVRQGVSRETAGRQVPFSYTGLTGEFVFRDAEAERAQLEEKLADLRRRAAEAQKAKDQQALDDIRNQQGAINVRLETVRTKTTPPTSTGGSADVKALRDRLAAEQTRLDGLTKGVSTVEEARAEVASLERRIASIRTQVDAARDEALRDSNVERGPFETREKFDARRSQAEADRAKIGAQFEREFDAQAKTARDRITALKSRTYPAAKPVRAEWRENAYDPDSKFLVARLDGADTRFTIAPEKAEQLYNRWKEVKVEATYAGAPVLVDPGTGERFVGAMRAWINPKDGLPYVSIEAGSFVMGCSGGDGQCDPDEKPAHRVTITRGFRIGATPVTQAAYQRVIGSNPSNFKGPQLPVETVSWDDARKYCSAVGMRLPTEAEWEYAARAGTTGARYGELDAIAWYGGNSGSKTHDVGTKQPNAWGLYDMLGNVWQWTADWYGPYAATAATDPAGAASGERRSLRGGS